MSGGRKRKRPVFGVTEPPKVDRAMEAFEALLDEWEDNPNPHDLPDRGPVEPTRRELRRQLTAKATQARITSRENNERHAQMLRKQGLSTAQIAVRMTQERSDPQRPPIDPRTVSRWLAKTKT